MYHIHKYSYRFLFLLSIAVILYATLYREAGQGDLELRLFWTIKRAWSEHSGYYWYLILGNIALFMPFGFFRPILRLRLRKWYCMLGMTFLLSLMIEITQLLTRVGSFDVDDLILNTSGGILGYLLFYIINKVRRKWNGA